MSNYNDLDTEPWYKQGWPWALIAIPFLTVVAGVITFIIANDTSDSLVQDDYYKKGLAINSNIERLELANKNNISASLTFDQKSNLLSAKFNATEHLSKQLILNFSHPTLKQYDHSILLTQLTDNEYIADLPPLQAAYWHLSLEDQQKTWLIKARWLYPDIKELKIGSHAD